MHKITAQVVMQVACIYPVKTLTLPCRMSTRPPSSKPPVSGARAGATRLQDIADHLGVSQATVSRALAGNAAISEATRAAVQQAATELGFRFGAGNRRVRKSTTRMIGLVVGNLHNSFMTQLLEALHDAFASYGYHTTLIIDSLNEVEQLARFRPLIDGYFDGMVFATATLDSKIVPELQRRGVPLVLVVRSVV